MTTRQQYTSTNVLTKEERFGYSSWRNLPWSYEREDPTITVGPNVWEHRYRYNAMGEREQKREWLTPAGDVTAPGYEWTYYLLGGSKEQMSMWKGMQTTEAGFCSDTGTASNVYLYPEEYLTYAIEYPGISEDIARLRLLPDGTTEYRITDHLASLRVSLDNTGTVTTTHDYEPYGDLISAGSESRQGFNSREKDAEHGLFNNGVRKLDDAEGRFTSIDPLWEGFRAWSPYQYGYNNPMAVTDPGGMQGQPALTIQTSDIISPIIGYNRITTNLLLTPILSSEGEYTKENVLALNNSIWGIAGAGSSIFTGFSLLLSPDPSGATKAGGFVLATTGISDLGLNMGTGINAFSNIVKGSDEMPTGRVGPNSVGILVGVPLDAALGSDKAGRGGDAQVLVGQAFTYSTAWWSMKASNVALKQPYISTGNVVDGTILTGQTLFGVGENRMRQRNEEIMRERAASNAQRDATTIANKVKSLFDF